MELIFTPNASTPAGHYSQAVVHGGLVFVSGLLPVTPTGEKLTDANVETQITQVLESLEAILTAAGSAKNKVLKCTVYISDIEDWPTINKVYAAFFGEHKPARAVVPVGTLHYGLNVELEAVAAV
ncbi:MAG: RidA family protein [Spirosomaceae bacterium]|nr:RidA family protein [Spirosomataceae bacterium]